MDELGASPAERSFTQQEQREAAEFILRLGNALLQAGYPINQISELLLGEPLFREIVGEPHSENMPSRNWNRKSVMALE